MDAVVAAPSSSLTQPAEVFSAEPARGSEAEQWAHLGKLLTKQSRRFDNLLPRVLAVRDADAVHDLRVCTRRLQQLLLPLRERGDQEQVKTLRRELRKVRRAMSEWRSYDVLLGKVARREQALRSPSRRAAWELLREATAKARRREIRRAQKKLFKPDHLNLRERAAVLFADVASPAGTETPITDILRAAVAKAFNQWRGALHSAQQTPQTENIHLLRIAMKKLRYRTELAGEFGAGDVEPRLAWLRSLQDRLGRWHDRLELSLMISRTLRHSDVLMEQPAAAIDLMHEIERVKRLNANEIPSILRELAESAGRTKMDDFVAAYTAPLATSRDGASADLNAPGR